MWKTVTKLQIDPQSMELLSKFSYFSINISYKYTIITKLGMIASFETLPYLKRNFQIFHQFIGKMIKMRVNLKKCDLQLAKKFGITLPV